MALFGVALDVNIKRINLDFKLFIAAQPGGASLRNLEHVFKQSDHNGSGKLDLEEFTKALNKYGLFLKKTDYQTLLKYYDHNGDGLIDF
jgi:Ca2+-binding EF-hand superfamily protein